MRCFLLERVSQKSGAGRVRTGFFRRPPQGRQPHLFSKVNAIQVRGFPCRRFPLRRDPVFLVPTSLITQKMSTVRTANFTRADRTAIGHEIEVRYINAKKPSTRWTFRQTERECIVQNAFPLKLYFFQLPLLFFLFCFMKTAQYYAPA